METLNESLKLTLIPTSLVWSKVSVMLDSTTGPAVCEAKDTLIKAFNLTFFQYYIHLRIVVITLSSYTPR